MSGCEECGEREAQEVDGKELHLCEDCSQDIQNQRKIDAQADPLGQAPSYQGEMDLARRLLARDGAAWREFDRQTRGMVTNLISQRLRDERLSSPDAEWNLGGVKAEDREDLAQEIYAEFTERLGNFEGRSKLSTFLMGIAKNKIFQWWEARGRKKDYFRKEVSIERFRGRDEGGPSDLEGHDDFSDDYRLDHTAIDLERPREEVVRIIDRLPPEKRRIMEETFAPFPPGARRGWGAADVAKKCGVAVEKVWKVHVEFRDRLRESRELDQRAAFFVMVPHNSTQRAKIPADPLFKPSKAWRRFERRIWPENLPPVPSFPARMEWARVPGEFRAALLADWTAGSLEGDGVGGRLHYLAREMKNRSRIGGWRRKERALAQAEQGLN